MCKFESYKVTDWFWGYFPLDYTRIKTTHTYRYIRIWFFFFYFNIKLAASSFVNTQWVTLFLKFAFKRQLGSKIKPVVLVEIQPEAEEAQALVWTVYQQHQEMLNDALRGEKKREEEDTEWLWTWGNGDDLTRGRRLRTW